MEFEKKIYGNNNKNVIFIFPHWKANNFEYWYLAKRLSIKYKVVLYNYPSEILSSNINNTIKNINLVVSDANKLAKEFALENSKIIYLGFSIGVILTNVLARLNQFPVKVINISAVSDFAENVWHSDKTKKIKKDLCFQNISLDILKVRWKELAPSYKIQNMNAKFLIILSKNDITAVYKLGKEFVSELKNNKKNFVLKIHKFLPHSILILFCLFKIKTFQNFIDS